MSQFLSKAELKRQMKAFILDANRGISVPLFADLCGVSPKLLREIFVNETRSLTETVQIRVNKAYRHWKMGNVRVMQRADNTRYVDYRREPKPVIEPSMGLKLTPQGIKLKIGPRNRHDYSDPTLDDELRG